MATKWARVQPSMLQGLQAIKGGTMLMATAAGKHVTFFVRDRRAPHAGRKAVKDAFIEAAAKTINIESRAERNAIVREEMVRRNLKTGVYHYTSRAGPRSKLYKKVSTRGQ